MSVCACHLYVCVCVDLRSEGVCCVKGPQEVTRDHERSPVFAFLLWFGTFTSNVIVLMPVVMPPVMGKAYRLATKLNGKTNVCGGR